MARFLWLELSLEWDPMLAEVFSRFAQLVADAGHTVEPISAAQLVQHSPSDRAAALETQIAAADAYIASSGLSVLDQAAESRELVIDQATSHKRLLVATGGPNLNALLDP